MCVGKSGGGEGSESGQGRGLACAGSIYCPVMLFTQHAQFLYYFPIVLTSDGKSGQLLCNHYDQLGFLVLGKRDRAAKGCSNYIRINKSGSKSHII